MKTNLQKLANSHHNTKGIDEHQDERMQEKVLSSLTR